MIPLPKPPASLKLEPTERVIHNGGWRKWKSSAVAAKEFREEFRRWALSNQEGRCAFCRLRIGREYRRTNTIDHFAPKGAHAYWTYESLNLFAVCESCNSEVKGEIDPVVGVAVAPYVYESASFDILHPYLDLDFASHLRGGFGVTDEPRALEGVTSRGIQTIKALGLDEQGILTLWIEEWEAAQWRKQKALIPPLLQTEYDEAVKELSGRS